MFLRVGGGVQDRDAALARQRELLSEVSQLRSQLDLMRSTCDQLRLNTRSPDRDDKVRRASVEGREDKDREDKVRRASVEGRDDEDRGHPGQDWKSEC